MPAAPSKKPAMPLEPRLLALRTDEQAPVDRGALEEAQPVEPQLSVCEHLGVGRRRVEHSLELAGVDRRLGADPLRRPRHPLDEHLVGQRAQVAVAQPHVTAHPVVRGPVERAAHLARTLTHSCPVARWSSRLTDATITQRIAPSTSGRSPVRRISLTSAVSPTPASAVVISASAASESARRASAPISPTVSRTDARTNRTRKRGTSGRGRLPVPRARSAESASTIGTIRVVRVSFTTTACEPAAWPNANAAATTDEVSLTAVPAQSPKPCWLRSKRRPSGGKRTTATRLKTKIVEIA